MKIFMNLLCYFLFLVFISPVLASTTELNVVTENWRPYNYKEGNEIKGVSTIIVKKVLDKAGIKYTIKVYPWNRAYNIALKIPLYILL